MKQRFAPLALAATLVVTGCSAPDEDTMTETATVDAAPTNLDTAAEAYVKLVLAVGQHDVQLVEQALRAPQQ